MREHCLRGPGLRPSRARGRRRAARRRELWWNRTRDGGRLGACRRGRGASGTARAQALAERTAIGRNGDLDDLAGISIFLTSPAPSYITAQILHLDDSFTIT